jgi:ketosteroid isomerase-like protein
METLSKATAFFFPAMMAILPAFAEDAARSLIEAEKSFAQTSLERGIHDSFLKFFADDCVVFAPGPTNGKKLYEKFKDEDRKLFWQPVFAAIAKSGEFGITTGPWEMRRSGQPVAFGQFLSVWRKLSDGNWKVIFDTGIDHPQPTQLPENLQVVQSNVEGTIDGADSALEEAERGLYKTMKQGGDSRLMIVAAQEIRVLRDNAFPAVGAPAARVMVNADPVEVTRKTSGSAISQSRDLACRYGSYVAKRGNMEEGGRFVTVWRLYNPGGWKVIVDLQKKDPDKKT